MENIQMQSSGSRQKQVRWAFVLLITVAMLLRLVLGVLNREANDNHVDVVKLIIETHALPDKHACWSCYQPRLYYLICAGVVSLLDIKETSPRILTMQLVNVFISFFILLLFWRLIDKQALSARSKYICFAFFAFNPCLVGINAQGTNDTLVIFFGILAVYACDSFFRENKITSALLLLLALILGAITKASALVLTSAIAVAFLIKICAQPGLREKARVTAHLSILILIFALIVPFAGEYYQNYKKYRNIPIGSWGTDPPAYFFKRTPIGTLFGRPGMESLFHGFFTFRLPDMVRQPFINNERNNYPMHRTSLWSQLYGRTMFVHFDQWPMSWQARTPTIVTIGRALIILGLVPLALFLTGILSNSLTFLRQLLRKERPYLAEPQNYLHLIVTLAFLASSVFYTYKYRDFASMKSIYIFPGLLAFIKMFLDGFALIRWRKILFLTEVVLALIVLLSIADVVFLIRQLA